VSQKLVEKAAKLLGRKGTSRRSFLQKTAIVGSAVAVAPADYLLRPKSAYAALFRRKGMPRKLSTNAFDGSMLRKGIPGQVGYQTFFNEAGRAFCLYVVLGNGNRRAPLVDLVNSVLATVRIEPRTAG
jgi:hypothetical protein